MDRIDDATNKFEGLGAVAASIAGLGATPQIRRLANRAAACERLYTELCCVSGHELDEVKRHVQSYHSSSPLDMLSTLGYLRRFYARYGCFPDELSEQDLATEAGKV